jgi:hypothetical protein
MDEPRRDEAETGRGPKIVGLEYVPLCKQCGQILWGLDLWGGRGVCLDCIYEAAQRRAEAAQ